MSGEQESFAVGTPVTRRPPHRSLRAELPHKAPTSGTDAQTLCLPYPFQRTWQVCGCDIGTISWQCPRFLASCPFRVVHIEPYRHCVRNLFCWNEFPLVRPLGSTFSANHGAPQSLFERFSATISLSDFPSPYIAVVLLPDSQRGPWTFQGQRRDLPAPV